MVSPVFAGFLATVRMARRVPAARDHQLVERNALFLRRLLRLVDQIAGQPEGLVRVFDLFCLKEIARLLF